MPKNQFYGAIMSQATVSAYYPNNTDFDHFVFQQAADALTDTDNGYSLVAYAVIYSGPPVLLDPLTPSNGIPVAAGKKVQYANMRLDSVGLNVLYPTGVTSDLAINPTGFYKHTKYIVYMGTASYTQDHELVVTSNPINPSPPHQG